MRYWTSTTPVELLSMPCYVLVDNGFSLNIGTCQTAGKVADLATLPAFSLNIGTIETDEERNEAIVRLYREGYKQEALAKMWGVDQGQISRIIGADERTKKICAAHNLSASHKLTPKHEQIIRRAPEELQDTIAEVVLAQRLKIIISTLPHILGDIA